MVKRLSHVLYQRTPGLLRAAAIGQDGRPWHLFHQAFQGEREALRAGQIVEARVRAIDPSGGVFLDHIGWKLWAGGYEPLFCDRRHGEGLAEGQTLNMRVMSAGRADHLARVVPARDDANVSLPEGAYEAWLERYEIERQVEADEAGQDVIAAAFEDAVAQTVPVPGGGALHIECTRAITAIDIDAAGRAGKGSAGARALALNMAAAQEAVRQLCLRCLGGAVILDCVGPLNEAAREKLRLGTLQVFDAYDSRKASVLKPSPFGLMELNLPWADAPMAEMLGSDETALLGSLKGAYREMKANAGGFYRLDLGQQPYEAYLNRKGAVDRLIKDEMFGRLTLARAVPGQEGMKRI